MLHHVILPDYVSHRQVCKPLKRLFHSAIIHLENYQKRLRLDEHKCTSLIEQLEFEKSIHM